MNVCTFAPSKKTKANGFTSHHIIHLDCATLVSQCNLHHLPHAMDEEARRGYGRNAEAYAGEKARTEECEGR